ncbi:MAG TPA: sigma-70 family RNA polymerase sigma factor [Polyangiaceae bacterium]|nr:sigma-70 family RNA polymerase sigma factor [Polyangiaceae bacterium]
MSWASGSPGSRVLDGFAAKRAVSALPSSRASSRRAVSELCDSRSSVRVGSSSCGMATQCGQPSTMPRTIALVFDMCSILSTGQRRRSPARALDALPPVQRDVLLMSAYQDMSHREIADSAVSRRAERCSLPA